MKTLIILFPVLISVNSYSAQPTLDPSAYKIKAKQVISNTLSLKQGLPVDHQSFLNEMITNRSKLSSGTLDIQKALKKINSNWVFFFVINHIERDNAAKFYWEFIQANDQLLAHRIRRTLKCYITSLETFETSYKDEMQKVNEKEYKKRLDSLDQSALDKIKIEEAATLAETIVENLKEQKVAA